MLPPYPMGRDEFSDLQRLPKRQQVGLLLGLGDT